MDFKSYVHDIKDFRKQGIVFKDITSLLKDAKVLKATTNELLTMIGEQKVDKVVGMESRGFFFAPLLALALNAGFVQVRKAGKLPYATLKEVYSLEYGEDILEIHTDRIQKGVRILIHDDLLAKGGTVGLVCRMIERMDYSAMQFFN